MTGCRQFLNIEFNGKQNYKILITDRIKTYVNQIDRSEILGRNDNASDAMNMLFCGTISCRSDSRPSEQHGDQVRYFFYEIRKTFVLEFTVQSNSPNRI